MTAEVLQMAHKNWIVLLVFTTEKPLVAQKFISDI